MSKTERNRRIAGILFAALALWEILNNVISRVSTFKSWSFTSIGSSFSLLTAVYCVLFAALIVTAVGFFIKRTAIPLEGIGLAAAAAMFFVQSGRYFKAFLGAKDAYLYVYFLKSVLLLLAFAAFGAAAAAVYFMCVKKRPVAAKFCKTISLIVWPVYCALIFCLRLRILIQGGGQGTAEAVFEMIFRVIHFALVFFALKYALDSLSLGNTKKE